MIAATTDFITITDFVPAANSFDDDDPYYFPVDNNGVIYKHEDYEHFEYDSKDQLCFVRIINSNAIPPNAFANCDNLRMNRSHG